MTVNSIIEKILAEAELKAAQILKDIQHEVEQLKVDVMAAYEGEKVSLEQKTSEKIVRAIKKAEVLAHMEGRNKLLTKKREIVEELLREIVQKLASLPAKDYEQLLASMMKRIHVQEGTIYPSEGKENSTKGAIKIAGKDFKVGPSKKIIGGFLFESEKVDIDSSFETLVYQVLRNELEHRIANHIF